MAAVKACFFRRYGGPEVLEYGELPDPAAAAGEVLIEIHAASINAADWKMRAGQYGAAVSFPHVPGRDFSGVMVSGGGFFKPGDAVFGVCEVPREGAYAERIAIREAIVAHKPEHLSFEEAATIPVAFLTAYHALHHHGRMQARDRVLIHSATGGVGLAALQLARAAGAEVFATA